MSIIASIRQFSRLIDRYYWQTAVLIAKNALARQYRNSFLGILWTLLQPMTIVMVYAAVLPHIMRAPPGSNYTLYVIVSVPIWNFFSATLYASSQSILANGETLKRCMISSTVFPVADVLRNTYTFFISFASMYGLAIVLGIAPLDPTFLLLPLYFIPVLMILGPIAIAIAFLAPYVRDIGDLVVVSMSVLFWLTPVAYEIEVLPPRIQAYEKWNPFYMMLHPLQMVGYDHKIPGLHDLCPLALLTVISIVVGFSIFRICRRNYVYYI